jgi:hypothetical protein
LDGLTSGHAALRIDFQGIPMPLTRHRAIHSPTSLGLTSAPLRAIVLDQKKLHGEFHDAKSYETLLPPLEVRCDSAATLVLVALTYV